MDSLATLLKAGVGALRASTPTPSATSAAPAQQVVSVGCDICGGTGWVSYNLPVGHSQFSKVFPCSCRLAGLERKQTAELMKASRMTGLERMTLDTFWPDGRGLQGQQRASLRRAFECAAAFACKPEGWLLLRGGCGCGKTHLAASIANECLSHGQSVLFVNVPDLFDYLRLAFGPNSDIGFDGRFAQVRDAPVLILDDLGAHNATPWAEEKLYQIVNLRYEAQLPTVVTTNRNLGDLEPRIASRLQHIGFVEQVNILAPDFRGGGADQEPEFSSLRFHRDQTWRSFTLREGELPAGDVENLRRALALAQRYAADPRGLLVFIGETHSGKTHLAAAIANHRVEQSGEALFVVVADLLDRLRATFDPNSPVRYSHLFERVKTAPFLVLDELPGKESLSPWAQEKLYQIVNYRYVVALSTVVTTGLPVEELDPKVATRFLDRSRSIVFALLAPAWRGGQTNRATVARHGGR